jgi:hypothetical protein
VDWYADPQPIPDTDREKSHCARCRDRKDSKELGRLLRYPAGNLHEKCAAAEQADDEAFRKG